MSLAMIQTLAPAFICYLVFHRWEPCSPWSLPALLLAPPSLVRLLTKDNAPLLATYATHLGSIIVLTLTYRLSPFHPLAKYPGPPIAAASKIWFALLSRRGKQHLYYKQLHMQYGDIVRTGPNELSFIEPNYINLILGPNGAPKGPYWDGRCCGQPKGISGIRNAIEHSKQRKKWQRAFTTQSLQGYEVFVEKRSTQLVDCLSKLTDEPLNLMEWISRFVFDIMMDLTYSRGLEMLADGDRQGMWNILERAMPDYLLFGHLPWFAQLVTRLPRLNKGVSAFRQLIMRVCTERIKEGAMNRDIMYYLMDEERIEDTPPSLLEIVVESAVAFVAGTDTVATTLSCLFYLLMMHPEKFRRLQEEVDSTTGHVFDTSVNASMSYLNAVIYESLRLFPPVPSGSSRAPAAGSGGHMVDKHFIPEGTSIGIHTYSVQRDARNFSSPELFLPERWLPANSPYAIHHNYGQEFKHNTAAFIPFSYGPANCIGKQLAMQEMRVVVRLMTERFNMRFADGYDPKNWERDLLDYFVMLKGRLPVVIESRSN